MGEKVEKKVFDLWEMIRHQRKFYKKEMDWAFSVSFCNMLKCV